MRFFGSRSWSSSCILSPAEAAGNTFFMGRRRGLRVTQKTFKMECLEAKYIDCRLAPHVLQPLILSPVR